MSSLSAIAVKVCGITQAKQALTIASLGADAIGIIGVDHSKRFLPNQERKKIFKELEKTFPYLERVLVVANPSDQMISDALTGDGCPSVIQLHGEESIEKCKKLKAQYQNIKWWKAFRINSPKVVSLAEDYQDSIDSILLDAWDPNELGGTGNQLPLEWLEKVNFQIPWWVAGGISSECIPVLLAKVKPYGIDASSKLEKSPGIKDLKKVISLLNAVKRSNYATGNINSI